MLALGMRFTTAGRQRRLAVDPSEVPVNGIPAGGQAMLDHVLLIARFVTITGLPSLALVTVSRHSVTFSVDATTYPSTGSCLRSPM